MNPFPAEYQSFVFESYAYDPERRRISLRYSFDGKEQFEETWELPEGALESYPAEELSAALFALHLAGGISYYKAACPPRIEVNSGDLTDEQAAFWNQFYEKGLGEFFYRNQLDFRGRISFPVTLEAVSGPLAEQGTGRYLAAIGGGKDSLVTIETLKAAGADVTLFRSGSHPVIDRLAQEAGRPLLTVGRQLDPRLFELNDRGALNGHVPITGYLSFLSVVVSLLYGFGAVVFSNERSSDYGNVPYLGMEINHQWSKTAEAERAMRAYLEKFVTRRVRYLNMLGNLSELRVAKQFAGYPQYLPLVTSCNRTWKILGERVDSAHWCGECPKCAFVFALLAAYVDPQELLQIFGKNLLDKESLQPLYRELLGIEGFKPFECVGTPEETAAALYLASSKPEFAGSRAVRLLEDPVVRALGELADLAGRLEAIDAIAVPEEVFELQRKGGLV